MSNTIERELEKRQDGHTESPEEKVFSTASSNEEHAHAALEDLVGAGTAAKLRVTAAINGNEPEPDAAELHPELHPTETTAVVLEKADGSDPASESVAAGGATDDEAMEAKEAKTGDSEEAKTEHRNPKPEFDALDLVAGGLRLVSRRVRPTQKKLWSLPLRIVASELEVTASVLESKAAHGLENLVVGAVRLPFRLSSNAWSFGKGMLSPGHGEHANQSQHQSPAH